MDDYIVTCKWLKNEARLEYFLFISSHMQMIVFRWQGDGVGVDGMANF